MNRIKQTATFSKWLSKVKDPRAKATVVLRIKQAANGNFGDVKSVGAGVSEMRIDVGKGYRVYFTRTGNVLYLLLCGGNKKNQNTDILKAKKMKKELK